jgi:hypothetical protein
MKRAGQKQKAANTERQVTRSTPADYLKTSLCLVLFLSCFVILLILTVTARKQFDATPISNSVVSTNLLDKIQGKSQSIPFRYVSDDEGQNLL